MKERNIIDSVMIDVKTKKGFLQSTTSRKL